MFLYIEKKESLIWVYNYFLKLNKKVLKIGSFLISKRKTFDCFLNDMNVLDFNKDTRFVKKDFPYNKEILRISNEYKISNIDLIKSIIFLEQIEIDIFIHKEYNLDGNIIYVSLYKNKDKILEIKDEEDDFDISALSNVKNGVVIMSKEKEDYIIKEISSECALYDLDLKNYDYYFEDLGNNRYNLNLEHIHTEKTIMIKEIILNDYNKIVSIGHFKGFVL